MVLFSFASRSLSSAIFRSVVFRSVCVRACVFFCLSVFSVGCFVCLFKYHITGLETIGYDYLGICVALRMLAMCVCVGLCVCLCISCR